jgi:CubicO group peptidase (beta-lactamase class C family)
MDKSIVNAMVGILVKKGKLSVNATAPIDEWLNDKRRDITLNDLLHMSSGLKWNEDYGDVSDATTMLYRERNCYKTAISVPFEKKPNTEWKYSSGTTNILSGIIRKTLNNDNLYFEFPYTEIFRKIGMNSMVYETDASGYFVGSSYGYATARDWARFGQLYLQDGVWKGDTILPKGWVSYTRTPADAAKGKYGAQFWLNRSKELKDIPEDMFFCEGHRGQQIAIFPSNHMVVVRLGFGEDKFDFNHFLKGILKSILVSG